MIELFSDESFTCIIVYLVRMCSYLYVDVHFSPSKKIVIGGKGELDGRWWYYLRGKLDGIEIVALL